MKIEKSICLDITVAEAARALAAQNSDDQALFFNEFRKALEEGANGSFNTGMQMSYIARSMGQKTCDFMIAFACYIQDELNTERAEEEKDDPRDSRPQTLADVGMCEADFR